jgi:hypothetical protein
LIALVTIARARSIAFSDHPRSIRAKEAAVSLNLLRTLSALALGLLTVLPVAAEAPAAKPTAKQIAQWIQQLGDNSFAVREAASKKLWAAGQAAEAALEEALKSDDAEVVRRARDILDKFKWGIYADTPADVVALIQAYHTTDGNARLETLEKLFQAGPAGLQAVLKISKDEKDPNQRRVLNDLVSRKLPAAFPKVLAERSYDKFEVLLELGHDGGAINDSQYAAYWLLRGKLDERIAHFRALMVKEPAEKRAAETLTYLYRAKDDLTEARRAAEKSGRIDLLEGILYEAADWKALAARPDLMGAADTIEKCAYRAAFARLAGDRKDAEAALADVSKQIDKERQRELAQFAAAKAFLLNDRPAEGLALLAKSPDRQTFLFEVLCARLQYREAMELVEKQPAESKERRQLEVLKARTLYLLGEKDKAQTLFAHLAEQIKGGVDPSWVGSLLETEYRLGLKNEAFEHCAKAIRDSLPEGAKLIRPGTYLSKVFPDQSETAQVWWELLRGKFTDDSPATLLKRVRDLMEGKIAVKDVKAWIEEADRRVSNPDGRTQPTEPARQRRALAEAAAAVGLDDLAHSLLEKAGTPEALIRLGDLLAGKKQWARAAERYRQAWETKNLTANDSLPGARRSDPLPLYLAGWALEKAGQEKEGKQLIEQSHWVPLGDAPARFNFLRVLVERGHTEAARRETDLLWRVSEPNSYYSGAALRRLAITAAARKDYRKAAEGFEQSMLRCLRTYTNFVQPGAYAGVPAQVHQLRARSLIAAGQIDEALRQSELALAASPGSVDLPIALVPELDRRGRKKEAAALFDRSFAVYEKVCQDYPGCAWAHNSAAWMSACCRRNLDKALEHARKAVELAPNNAGYLDTLAEVYFQRGDQDKAVAAQKRVVELDPKRPYFRKQLRRLQAGDPSAERPPEDSE